MKAFVYNETGPAKDVLKIIEVPTPLPKSGEVRIQVRASGINPSDTKRRSGAFPQPQKMTQVIPHSDGSGVIDRIGRGVEESWLGKRVWFHNAQWDRADGAAGEYVVLPLESIACLPEQVPFDAGASFGVPLLTAWYCIHRGGELAGKTVFIAGGAGSVGGYAVQLAKKKGAKVITTVSNDQKAKKARAYGADHIINYTKEDVESRVSLYTDGRGIDLYVEVNLSANAKHIAAMMASEGQVVVYGSEHKEAALTDLFTLMGKHIALSFFLVYQLPLALLQQAKAEIHELLSKNELKFNVGHVFDFGDIAEAHASVENGADGHVILCQCPAQISDYLQQLDSIS